MSPDPRAWLVERGYTPERPICLPKGLRNPDYWAVSNVSQPPELWAEVKSIDEDDSTAVLVKYHRLVSSIVIPDGLSGYAHISIEPKAVEQSIRWTLRFFTERAPQYAGQKIALAFLQQSATGTDIHRVEIGGEEPAVVWVRGAGDRRLKAPMRICDAYHSPAKLIRPDFSERVGEVFHFFEWTEESECEVVAHLDPRDAPLTHISSMSGGAGQGRERTVRALEDANQQIKEACSVRAAPGIVFLVPQGPFAEDFPIQTAAYGVLTAAVNLKGDHSELGEAFHGKDGVFRHDKNRHISAAKRDRRAFAINISISSVSRTETTNWIRPSRCLRRYARIR